MGSFGKGSGPRGHLVLSQERPTDVFENEIGFAHAIAHIYEHEQRSSSQASLVPACSAP